jgi:hypothetical protein
MLGRFHRLGFEQDAALEADLVLVLNHQREEVPDFPDPVPDRSSLAEDGGRGLAVAAMPLYRSIVRAAGVTLHRRRNCGRFSFHMENESNVEDGSRCGASVVRWVHYALLAEFLTTNARSA